MYDRGSKEEVPWGRHIRLQSLCPETEIWNSGNPFRGSLNRHNRELFLLWGISGPRTYPTKRE